MKIRTSTLVASFTFFVTLTLIFGGPAWASLDAPKWVVAVYAGGRSAVGLLWNGVPGATGYRVLRSSVGGRGYQEISRSNAVSTREFDRDLAPGTVYRYTLQALSATESGPVSDEKIVAVPAPVVEEKVLPPVIKNIAAYQITRSGSVSFKVDVTWSPSNGNVVAYNIYRSTTPGKDYSLVLSSQETHVVDDKVEEGKTYYYVVTALDNKFAETAYSNEMKSVELKREGTERAYEQRERGGWDARYFQTLRGVRIVVLEAGNRAFKVLRSSVSGKDYREVARAQRDPVKDTNKSYAETVDKGVLRGTTYYYVIEAVGAGESGAHSAEVAVTVPPQANAGVFAPPVWDDYSPVVVPDMKQGEGQTTSTKIGYKILNSWDDVAGAVSYKVYRCTYPEKEYKFLTSTIDPWYDDQVPGGSGTAYYYALKAVNASGAETPFSEIRYVYFKGNHPVKEFYKVGERARWGSCADCHLPHRASSGERLAPQEDRSAGSRMLAEDVDAFQVARHPLVGAKDASGAVWPLTSVPPAPRPTAVPPSPSPVRGSSGKPTYEAFGEVFDEVWVIERFPPSLAPPPLPGDENRPGSGELRASVGGKTVPFPLKHTDVLARVTGYVAEVLVTQEYQNPYSEKIEAVYVFPLPDNSAVSDFVMKIGDRKIRGIIREREEAQQIYQEARSQGYVASLLTQERPNVFTQRVANIEPGKRIDIEIAYFNTLAYQDGVYSFVFPMVVGPRYNPAGSKDGVGAVARGSGGISGQSTEVQYLKPGERPGHDIMVTVDLEAGVPLEEISSPSHAVKITKRGPTTARVSLKPADTFPNKDFVMTWKVAGKTVKSALMVERGEKENWFTLMLQPPGNLSDLPRTGQEMVLLLDTSGSMSGFPIEKSRAAARRVLKSLGPEDSFQIVRFSGDNSQFAPQPLPATPENIERGLQFIDRLQGSGGTEMLKGIAAALDFPHDEKRFRTVAFMTDGYVGNEAQILKAVAEKLGPARIFSFGIGNAVNRYLMEGLARIGHGAVAYILLGDSSTEAVDKFFQRVGHPALTDIQIDWGGMTVTDIYPKQIPDMFVGRPVMLTGKFTGHGETDIKITGLCGGERQVIRVKASLDDPEARHRGISRIWARARIADLSDTMITTNTPGMKEEIKRTALNYGLVSAYTSFVAVDSSRVTAGDHGTTAVQPVPVPEGVRYDTTVMPFDPNSGNGQ